MLKNGVLLLFLSVEENKDVLRQGVDLLDSSKLRVDYASSVSGSKTVGKDEGLCIRAIKK